MRQEVTLTYPSVIKIESTCKVLRGSYLALWLQGGLPQHCQCSSPEEGWYIIQQKHESIDGNIVFYPDPNLKED